MLGNILSTGEQVLILVVLLAVGFLCGKIRIFNDQSISHLSAFALKIVGPCAIVESFCRQFDSAMLRAMGIVALPVSYTHLSATSRGPTAARQRRFTCRRSAARRRASRSAAGSSARCWKRSRQAPVRRCMRMS